MGFYASDIVGIATKQIGYHEKDNDSALYGTSAGGKNHTKFAKELHDAGFFNGDKCGYDWCAVFVTWCAWKLTGSKEKAMNLLCQSGPYGAGCTQSRGYYLSAGRYDKNPKVGDQVIFNSGSSKYVHTGIVINVDASYITTIEGNSANMVAQRKYRRNDANIDGYGHPRYGAEPVKQETKAEEMCEVKMPYLKLGSKGEAVRSIQRICKNFGYYTLNIDGEYGPKTVAAVKKLQAYLKVGVDGEVGAETYGALFK